jgi:hypothetical protein
MGRSQQVVDMALGVGKGSHNQTSVNCKGLFPKGQVLSEKGILRAKD